MTPRQSATRSRSPGRTAEYAPAKRHRIRIRIALWLFVFALVRIGVRLVGLHLDPQWDVSKEDKRHIGRTDIEVPRGDVFDRKERLLATDQQLFSLAADPSRIADAKEVDAREMARRLADRLDLEEGELHARLTRRGSNGQLRRSVWLKRWLNPGDVESIGDLGSIAEAGLYFRPEPLRFYPQGQLAAHVLGYVFRDRDRSRPGIGEGIELAYDGYLRSTPGALKAWKDRNLILLPSLTLDYEPPRPGADVFLTIDAAVQSNLECELDRALDLCKADRAMGIVMDPDTGAIVALACRPAFDPNAYWEASDEERANRAVSDLGAFEPGSAFKIVVAAGALEEKLIRPEDPIDCENGTFRPYGRRRITDTHPLEVVPFSEAFAESSNIALAKLAALMGEEGLEGWIRRFGFGQRTGCDLPGESPGIVHPREDWSKASLYSLAFGHEVSVTLLQLARAYCAIGNGGLLVTPHVVESVVSAEGAEAYRFTPGPERRILHESTAEVMRDLCHGVVTHGTGIRANIPEYRVGGKTGTAQIAKSDGSGYYDDRYKAVFAGFAPVADPRLCAVIVVDCPEMKKHYGGYAAAPVFRNVVEEALIGMNCPQDPVRVAVETPPPIEGDADTVIARAELDLMEPPMEEVLASLDGLELVNLETDPSSDCPRLPSFLGMTMRQAKEEIVSLGLHWRRARGSGWVVYQDPAAGTPLYEVSVCRLVFSNDRSRPKREPPEHEAEGIGASARL